MSCLFQAHLASEIGAPPPGSSCIGRDYYLCNFKGNRYYILVILNSKLLNWRFKTTSTNNHVSGDEVRALPIRRINFTTPQQERERLAAEAKRLYYEGLEKAGLNGGDRK